MKQHDIVTIGNGTGQGVMLQALRKLTDLDRVTALVGVTDNGGHAGALRRELHTPSVGDVKTVISALAGETVWGQLVRHRFTEGRLTGVSMGNLILAALMDEGGSLYHAARRLCQALELKVHLIPISDDDVQVVAKLADGSEVVGEWEIIRRENIESPIVGVRHEPAMETNPQAIKALKNAHLIIVCPGTLWLGIGSILAAPGVKEAIQDSSATIIAVGNVLTQPGITDGMTAQDHLTALNKLLGRKVDYYLRHDGGLPAQTMKIYEEKGFKPVVDDLINQDTQIVRGDLVSAEFVRTVDRVHYDEARGNPHAMRHDPAMLARILLHVSEATPEDEHFEPQPKKDRYLVKDW